MCVDARRNAAPVAVFVKLPEESDLFVGHFLLEELCLEELCLSKDLYDALMEGLAALTRREEVGIAAKEE